MTNTTLMVAVGLPAGVIMATAVGLYVRARRIEYRLATEAIERVLIAVEAAAKKETWITGSTIATILRTFEASSVFRQLNKTGVQRAVLIKACKDLGRHSTLTTSVTLDGIVSVIRWVGPTPKKTRRTAASCISVLKALFVPGIKK